jgi:hypothetical protein
MKPEFCSTNLLTTATVSYPSTDYWVAAEKGREYDNKGNLLLNTTGATAQTASIVYTGDLSTADTLKIINTNVATGTIQTKESTRSAVTVTNVGSNGINNGIKKFGAGSLEMLGSNTIFLSHFETLVDSSLYTKTLTAGAGAAVSATQKKFGTNSLYLNGASSQYVTISSHADFGWSLFNGLFTYGTTIDAFVYVTNLTYGAAFILCSATGYQTLSVYFDSQAILNVWAGGSHLTFNDYGNGSNIISLNTWHHLRVTIEDNGKRCRAYIDGATLYYGYHGPTYQDFGTIATIAANDIYIGKSAGNDSYYNGYIDELRIIKGCINTETSFTVPTTTHSAGQCLTFTNPIANLDEFTIETRLLFPFQQNYLTGSYLYYFDSNNFFQVWAPVSSGVQKIRVGLKVDGSTVIAATYYTGSVSLNTWYHLALVKKDGGYNVYIDGALVVQGSASSNLPSGTIMVGGKNSSPGSSMSSAAYMFGAFYLDDFAMYNYAKYTHNFTPSVSELTSTDYKDKIILNLNTDTTDTTPFSGYQTLETISNSNKNYSVNLATTSSMSEMKVNLATTQTSGQEKYLGELYIGNRVLKLE